MAADTAPIAPSDLAPLIEAVVFSVDRPIAIGKLAEVLGLSEESGPAKGRGRKSGGTSPSDLIRESVAILNEAYEVSGRAFRIESVAGGFRVMILSKFAPVLAAYHGARARTTLSRAAVETLAIIAYRQPITRAKLEAVRGVACGEILRSLIERKLVEITGRADELGRPLLYGTSRRFLEAFGLATLKDLPSVEELRQRSQHDETPSAKPAPPVTVLSDAPSPTEPAGLVGT